MTDLLALTEKFAREIEWQIVPDDLTLDDCIPFVLTGIQKLYVMTGRAMSYSDALVIKDENGYAIGFNETFPLDEELYILTCAKIAFYTKVQSDVNELESYTTDAMSVANADKPFRNLADMINDLKREQAEIWHKMVRYNML